MEVSMILKIIVDGIAFLLALMLFAAIFALAYFLISSIVVLIISDIKSIVTTPTLVDTDVPDDNTNKQPVDIDDSKLMEAARNMTGDADMVFNRKTK